MLGVGKDIAKLFYPNRMAMIEELPRLMFGEKGRKTDHIDYAVPYGYRQCGREAQATPSAPVLQIFDDTLQTSQKGRQPILTAHALNTTDPIKCPTRQIQPSAPYLDIIVCQEQLPYQHIEQPPEDCETCNCYKLEERVQNAETSNAETQKDDTFSIPTDMIICPVCMEYYLSEQRVILQCSSGHCFCSVCDQHLPTRNCPECRCDLELTGVSRNRLAERFCQHFHEISWKR